MTPGLQRYGLPLSVDFTRAVLACLATGPFLVGLELVQNAWGGEALTAFETRSGGGEIWNGSSGGYFNCGLASICGVGVFCPKKPQSGGGGR